MGWRRVLTVGGIVAAVSLAAGELAVRQADHRPWTFFGRELEKLDFPLMHEPDPDLGWISKPGVYTYPLGFLTRQPEVGDLELEIWPNLSRATAPEPHPREERVITVGCSFTFGWALRDDETFSWRLQESLPGVEVLNFGTGGYGSYQSLLRIERYLERGEGPTPRLVIYGLAGGHGTRDVAIHPWQQMLSGKASEPVPLPRASVAADGTLRRHPPEAYPVWPGSQTSALVAWLQDRYARWRAEGREAQADAVQMRVVREMDRVVRRRGSRLLVVLLAMMSPEQDRAFRAYFDEVGVDYVACLDARYGRPEFRVPVDGHPNAAMNAIWADCIEAAVRERLGVE